MKRNVSNHSHRDEKLRLSRNGNYEAGLRRTEEERLRRRREWMIEQQRLREHEKLKEKKILEYEIRRAIEKGLPLPRGRFSHHSRSKSKSKSTENRHRTVTSNTSNTSILSKKLEPSDGTTPLFKGPEGTQVSAAELRRIKVDIHRNVPGKATTDDLQRDIINPEDVLVKRREGEGSKPIFEREEIKGTTVKTDEIEERRTVVVLNNENLESKSKMNKKYTTSSRNRSPSPRHRSSRHARYEDSKYDNRDSYRSDRGRNHSRGRSREYKETVRRHSQLNTAEEEHLRERKGHRDHSRSREREQRAWVRDSHHRSSKDERSYRERSRERSRERRERDRSREHRIPPSHYIEQIPVPVYYGDFPPRPIMVGPLVPIRGQVPPLGGTRHMIGPLRPFPPRFIPPDMYRLRPPLNPRFRPMY
ncbi:zinc finger CCCH domain-containing protein 13 isoform X1 [Bombus impatiens]|uniref:Zinc finger CCCH domain-containing protein 13-like isoform X1 n=2 Tax=Pyrobombus TaxID=144703 RepID=A0A6P8MK93_9HYME|nr:zinc finger CCCH domain-containing protein 13 isoform X1 [Bombus impatiens]XP_033202828.1 zinc finger CCCH domain-containing protein 13-like isoform X1 [Bombus vancouverensis nearcticus]XP_033309674.1 zinc finger CCCH domain-containing protein 13-like isoform X1 [Bombus bifarius]